ncbi:MAG: hypothetical protein OXC25_04075 [Thiotrichales bacterium]|nr:hypothetical protein [Thiotrichales bacterium]MCY4349009.1 hypothetical protein [Thiotrichales bacterium]
MTRLQIVGFCVLALAGTAGVCAALFPHASLSRVEAAAARTALPMEEFDLVDLGDDYGPLTVFELVGYYLDNPPPPEIAVTVSRKKHFGGC